MWESLGVRKRLIGVTNGEKWARRVQGPDQLGRIIWGLVSSVYLSGRVPAGQRWHAYLSDLRKVVRNLTQSVDGDRRRDDGCCSIRRLVAGPP